MKKALDLILIISFVVVDFLLFHDAFKAGEVITAVQWLIGALSIIAIVRALQSLFGR